MLEHIISTSLVILAVLLVRAVSRYFNNEDREKWYRDNMLTFPDTSFEIEEQEYILVRQENGKWAFSKFDLPY